MSNTTADTFLSIGGVGEEATRALATLSRSPGSSLRVCVILGGMASEPLPSVARALSLDGSAERLAEFYDEWAARYDEEVGGDTYRAPQVTASMVRACGESLARLAVEEQPSVIDAGCGTGLVGECLAELGYECVDGFDLSNEMVEQARSRACYRRLWGGVDMSLPISVAPDGSYDIAVSTGVFTLGHVPASALDHLVALVRPGGVVIVSTRHQYIAEAGFDVRVEQMVTTGQVTLVEHIAEAPYAVDDTAQYWILQVN